MSKGLIWNWYKYLFTSKSQLESRKGDATFPAWPFWISWRQYMYSRQKTNTTLRDNCWVLLVHFAWLTISYQKKTSRKLRCGQYCVSGRSKNICYTNNSHIYRGHFKTQKTEIKWTDFVRRLRPSSGLPKWTPNDNSKTPRSLHIKLILSGNVSIEIST